MVQGHCRLNHISNLPTEGVATPFGQYARPRSESQANGRPQRRWKLCPGRRLSEASANLNMLLRYRRSPHPRPNPPASLRSLLRLPQIQAPKRNLPRTKSRRRACPTPDVSAVGWLEADSEIARRKAEESNEATKREAEAKKMQVSGDLSVGDIVVNGQAWMDIGDDFTTKRRLRICALLAKIM